MGKSFFEALVGGIASHFGYYSSFVCRIVQEPSEAELVSIWAGSQLGPTFKYHVEGTPCGEVRDQKSPIIYSRRVADAFPKDEWLRENGIESYVAVPFVSEDGRHLGHLGVMDRKPIENHAPVLSCLEILGARAAAELKRMIAENELRISERKLRRLSARLLNLQEEERKRISRELHDEFGQTFMAFKFGLEKIRREIREDGQSEKSKLDASIDQRITEMMESVDCAIETTRRVARELRPSVLDHLGLQAGIKYLVEEFAKTNSAKTHLDVEDDQMEINDSVSVALFRVLQEALTNVSRHSGASLVRVVFANKASGVTLVVRDNGKGFVEEKFSESVDGQRFDRLGLIGMQERLSLVGGFVDIKGKGGKGTVVSVRVPRAQCV